MKLGKPFTVIQKNLEGVLYNIKYQIDILFNLYFDKITTKSRKTKLK